MKPFKDNIPDGFNNPTALPKNNGQEQEWQEANRLWWENNPMRYDWKKRVDFPEFSKDFFLEIDNRFFSNAQEYMPWKKIPFDYLIDFELLKDKDVLEIGVGNGSHAQLLAQHSKSFTGIDITQYAVKSTSERMRFFGLNAIILSMDAEKLEFNDNTFDFIWSWGVIHHSANTLKILHEIERVLKPGGQTIIMVYHRSFWNYYVMAGFLKGILLGNLLKTKSLHKTMQRSTDGAMARYYSIPEWKNIVSEIFSTKKILIYGQKAELIPLPGGKIKNSIMKLIPNSLSRFLTNNCKMGGFLVSILEKNR